MQRTYLAAFLVFTVVVAMLIPIPASASAGVGIAPGKLHFQSTDEDLTQTLYVINTGTERSDYEVFAEGECASWFQIDPIGFDLQPDESKAITIAIVYPENVHGEHNANISVAAFASSADNRFGTGVKVPTQISIGSSKSQSGVDTQVTKQISMVSETTGDIGKTGSQSGHSMTFIVLICTLVICVIAASATVFVLHRRRGVEKL